MKEYETVPLKIEVPHHTQYVERAIRVVNDCGKRSTSFLVREGMALSTMESRKARPKVETKRDFMSE